MTASKILANIENVLLCCMKDGYIMLTHVGNSLGEVRKKCQVMIMISCDIESILFESSITTV